MDKEEKFKIPPREVQQAVIDRVLMRLEARRSSFTREDVIGFAKEAQIPTIYAEAISPAVIEDLGGRIFSRLLVNGMLIPVKGTKYYRKITNEEMQAAKKAYLAAQQEDEENGEELIHATGTLPRAHDRRIQAGLKYPYGRFHHRFRWTCPSSRGSRERRPAQLRVHPHRKR